MSAPHPIGATVRDRVTEELRERILTAKLLPGERIDFDVLSQEFGTSRTPVREAVLALAHDGLAKMTPRSGAVVVGLTSVDIQDNFALMAILAGVAAMWACERATDEDLAVLRELTRAIEEAAREGEDIAEKNLAFHRHINRCAKSERLLFSLRSARRQVPQTFFDLIPEQVDTTLVEHDELVRAILSRSGPDARAIAEKHFMEAGRLLAQRYTALIQARLQDSAIESRIARHGSRT